MAIPQLNEGYTRFPYPAGDEGDASNVGGIDLLAAPDRVSEMPETVGLYYLPLLLRSLNEAAGPLLTMGCGFWEGEGRYYSYLEFGWHDVSRMPEIGRLDEAFLQWAIAHCDEFTNVYNIIQGNVDWTSRTVYHERLQQPIQLLTFMVCGLSVYEVEYVYQALRLFLSDLSV